MGMIGTLKREWREGDGLVRLLAANVVVFVLIQCYLLVWWLMGGSGNDAPLGEDMLLAAASSMERMASRPWSVITHMFAHVSFGHFLLNIIGLYVCGKLLKSFSDSRKVVLVYLLSGISGYALYALFYNVFPALRHDSLILGASAAVMGIITAAAALRPRFQVKLFGIFDLQLVWLAAILVLLDLVSIRKGINSGGHIGHLGGAIFGVLYARSLKHGKPMAGWMERWLRRLGNLFSRRPRMSVHTNPRGKTDEQFNAEKRARQKRVDEILDKIGRSGYDSLSKEEKDFLFRYSQK